jgi:hypothetical protein
MKTVFFLILLVPSLCYSYVINGYITLQWTVPTVGVADSSCAAPIVENPTRDVRITYLVESKRNNEDWKWANGSSSYVMGVPGQVLKKKVKVSEGLWKFRVTPVDDHGNTGPNCGWFCGWVPLTSKNKPYFAYSYGPSNFAYLIYLTRS